MEEIRSISTVIAVLVSFWSAYTVRRLWYQANRPIISVEIKENTSGVGEAIFDMIIHNSGNRPATDIVINAKTEDVDKILVTDTSENIKNEIYQIFSKTPKIQLLLNNDNTKTAFFGFSTQPSEPIYVLNYEAQLPIELRYLDLDGNRYVEKQSLYIRDSNGFSGSVWESKT